MVSSVRERVGLTHGLTGAVMECEVEVCEVERPAGLPVVEVLGSHEVLQVLVVCPDFKLVFRSFDEVSPFLQCTDDREHFLVVYLVIPLYWR